MITLTGFQAHTHNKIAGDAVLSSSKVLNFKLKKKTFQTHCRAQGLFLHCHHQKTLTPIDDVIFRQSSDKILSIIQWLEIETNIHCFIWTICLEVSKTLKRTQVWKKIVDICNFKPNHYSLMNSAIKNYMFPGLIHESHRF